MSDWPALLKETTDLIVEAGKRAQKGRADMESVVKPDGSIVTNVDKEIETFLREELPKLTPGAGFWGEEFGHSDPTDAGQWLLDPIDGTSNYAFGQPLWGVTVGFYHSGALRLGVTYLPDLDNLLTAAHGHGAHLNGKALPPIPSGDIKPVELLSVGDSEVKLNQLNPGKLRHIGAFCVEVTFVAKQNVRAMTTGQINLYDCAGGILACRELGADVRHIDGTPFEESQWVDGSKADPFYIGPANSNFPFGRNL